MLDYNKYVVAVEVVHYLSEDYVFHKLIRNTGISIYVVGWVCLVSFYQNSCGIGLLPVLRYLVGVE